MDCSCPDWEVPCKHIAAAFYLLAEAFDDDPFTILAWRGRDREDLLANLQAARGDGSPAADIAPPGQQATASGALLGQLHQVNVSIRGKALADILEPAYARFQDSCS